MEREVLERVAVLGAGTMGHGIAQAAARGGYQVLLYDLERRLVEKGLARVRENLEKGVVKGKIERSEMEAAFDRILGTADLEHAAAAVGLVVEAVPEKLDLKQDLFRRVSKLCRSETVLATNTSSLSVTKIAEVTNCPERVVGMHFFNPVHIMKLLEVVRGQRTDEATVRFAVEAGKRMGKTPIVVQDSPGFASSRLGLALGLEAIRMLEKGVASARDIDTAMELGYNHPVGPLRLTDQVGLDVRLAIAEVLEKELGTRFRPPELLRKKVREGKLGKKSGEGFYTWP